MYKIENLRDETVLYVVVTLKIILGICNAQYNL